MLIMLDKDGTITETRSGKPAPTTPDDQFVLPGVLEMMHYWHRQGHVLAIVSNQGYVMQRLYWEHRRVK